MKTSSLCSILLMLAAACSGSPKTSTVQNGEGSASGTSEGSGSDEEPIAEGPGIGEDCGEDDTCAAGLECVHYYGFAGASGPEFKTCEIRCDGKEGCPDGLSCATIADGPGPVCRP